MRETLGCGGQLVTHDFLVTDPRDSALFGVAALSQVHQFAQTTHFFEIFHTGPSFCINDSFL
jgi:hypothetical protein